MIKIVAPHLSLPILFKTKFYKWRYILIECICMTFISLFRNPALLVHFFVLMFTQILFFWPSGNVNTFLQYLVSILFDRFVYIYFIFIVENCEYMFPIRFYEEISLSARKSISVLSQPTSLLRIIFR